MQPINELNVNYQLQKVEDTHVAIAETKPDAEDRRDEPHYEVMGAIQALLQRANLESENGFTVVINVQGSTESGRVIQCVVLEDCQGPLEMH